MKKLVITHGRLASGFKAALDVIIGNSEALDAIDCFVDDTPLKDLVETYMSEINLETQKVLVMTDLPAGSVNQYFMTNYQHENVLIVSGVNLPLILELVLMDEELLTTATIGAAVEMAHSQLVLCDSTPLASSGDDFDF